MAENVISAADRDVLRRVAEEKMAVAAHPVNRERRDAWLALDSGTGGRPMILAEWGGVDDPKRPGDCSSEMRCAGRSRLPEVAGWNSS